MTDRSTDSITIPRRSMQRAGLAILAAIVLIAIAFGIAALVGALRPSDSLAAAINSHEYQFVSLTNGESYFGKLTSPGGGFYYMRHVYTLSAQTSGKTGTPLQRTLTKLVNEIHGPEDLVVINRTQIVYMENLRPNGCAAILMRTGQRCP
jgi:hypothetical protein